MEGFERVGAAGVGEAEAVGDAAWLGSWAVLDVNEQPCDGKHLGMGDHVGMQHLGSGNRGGQPPVALVPAVGERGVPPELQLLGGDVAGQMVCAGGAGVREGLGALVVAVLGGDNFGKGGQAGAVRAA
jgi:hypothetical protein